MIFHFLTKRCLALEFPSLPSLSPQLWPPFSFPNYDPASPLSLQLQPPLPLSRPCYDPPPLSHLWSPLPSLPSYETPSLSLSLPLQLWTPLPSLSPVRPSFLSLSLALTLPPSLQLRPPPITPQLWTSFPSSLQLPPFPSLSPAMTHLSSLFLAMNKDLVMDIISCEPLQPFFISTAVKGVKMGRKETCF